MPSIKCFWNSKTCQLIKCGLWSDVILIVVHFILILFSDVHFMLISVSELEMAGMYNYSVANMENESLQTNRYAVDLKQKLTH